MENFYRQLFILPAWFNFISPILVILQPGEISNEESKGYWDKRAPPGESDAERIDRVRKTLFEKVYGPGRMGFEWYVQEVGVPESRLADGTQDAISVCGRTVSINDFKPDDQVRVRALPEDRLLPPLNTPARSPLNKKRLGKNPLALVQKSLKKAYEQVEAGDASWTRKAFPPDVDILVFSLPAVADRDVTAMRKNLRVDGAITFWAHRLAVDNDDEEFAFNRPRWIGIINRYLDSDRPTLKDLQAVGPAHAMVWILQHMTAVRQASFVKFIMQRSKSAEERNLMQLEGVRLIRVAIDNLTIEVILGEDKDVDGTWEKLVDDVARGGPQTQSSMEKV